MTADHDQIDRPTKPVDTAQLRRKLVAVGALTKSVLAHLGDLETLAYEPTVGERVGGGTAKTREGHAHTDTGDRRAKVALERLVAGVDAFAKALGDAERVVTAGPGADEQLRGTLLGDPDTGGAAAELGRLVKQQNERRDRGDYTPSKVVDQPTVPGYVPPKER